MHLHCICFYIHFYVCVCVYGAHGWQLRLYVRPVYVVFVCKQPNDFHSFRPFRLWTHNRHIPLRHDTMIIIIIVHNNEISVVFAPVARIFLRSLLFTLCVRKSISPWRRARGGFDDNKNIKNHITYTAVPPKHTHTHHLEYFCCVSKRFFCPSITSRAIFRNLATKMPPYIGERSNIKELHFFRLKSWFTAP